MKIKNQFAFLLVSILLALSSAGYSTNETLNVGFQIEPPFVIKSNNSYEGVSIELWRKIADSLNYKYNFISYSLDNLLIAVEKGDIDIAISPLSVTSTRIKKFDFTQPYYITNLAFATQLEKDSGLLSFIEDFFTLNFMKALFSLFMIILIFGLIVWFFERKKNPEQFRKGIDGVGDGIWWSAVTMSTVGYGDKSPVTFGGRVLGLIWMFTAVIIISSLTAGISSSLTVHKLSKQITTFEDLRERTVGCIDNTGTAEFLGQYKIKFKNFPTVKAGLTAVDKGEIEAFVYDEAILRYYVQADRFDEEIKVIPSAYFKEYFSFATNRYDLVKEINQVLIGIIESTDWEADLDKYGIEYKD